MGKLFNIITEWETDWLREKVVQHIQPFSFTKLHILYLT
jgi:hypothetical protein